MSMTEEERRAQRANERRIQGFGRLLLAAALLAGLALVVQLVRGPSELVRRARVIEGRAKEKYRPQLAERIAVECRKSACACASSAARIGLDLDVGNDVLALVDLALAECPEQATLPGIRAEALARVARPEGQAEASRVLEREPNNPNAHYALGLVSYRAGKVMEALESLQGALRSGRGAEAHLLAGLIFYNLGRLDAAEPEFAVALKLDPTDPAALYNLALVYHQQSRFAQAREGYLNVLRVNPTHADARFNLAVLAHSLRALDEANHHLRKFKELEPGADAVKKLEAIVATPVPQAPKLVPASAGSAAVPAASAGH
jgi:tetratricopeptide (TPR) repeat protein